MISYFRTIRYTSRRHPQTMSSNFTTQFTPLWMWLKRKLILLERTQMKCVNCTLVCFTQQRTIKCILYESIFVVVVFLNEDNTTVFYISVQKCFFMIIKKGTILNETCTLPATYKIYNIVTCLCDYIVWYWNKV